MQFNPEGLIRDAFNGNPITVTTIPSLPGWRVALKATSAIPNPPSSIPVIAWRLELQGEDDSHMVYPVTADNEANDQIILNYDGWSVRHHDA